MANEIQLSTSIKVANGNFAESITRSLSVNQSNIGAAGGSQVVPTTSAGTAITISTLTAFGFAVFQNLDATNFVQIGVQVSGTFYPLLKLFPGESNQLRLEPSATPYARADTASVKLFSRVYEN